nr:PREDICTED: venom carboxylesterase-6-like isoform X2 [Tribolium castaneum]|eukprot:XP_015840856.1 PREDICTED: venom carboxylesterase-6-like isoform X2 [Tribolium castaneum]
MRHFALFALFNFGFSDIVIHLPDGSIRGKQSVTLTHKKFYSFEKIPYAAPPIGELRFQAPILPKKWDGVLNTTRSDAICYQVAGDFSLESEDCLYLNVYTPKVDALLPVIFYIHGGGFIGGACTSSICGPEFFIDYNVVVVTINYRLGPFGFLSTQDTEIPGNNGLKDQQLALKWARNNIILFGGDPSRITIVGQSAGSASVTYQILNKNSKVTADELDKASYRVHQTETLQNRQISQGYFYAPVLEVEHEDAFITRKMFGDLKIGNFVKVPIIIGITSEEALEDANDLSLLKNIMKTYDDNLDWLVPHDLNVKDKQKRKMIGEIIRSFYTGSKLQDDLSAGIRFFSDNSFTRSVIKHAQLQSKFTNVYFYQFSYDGMIGNVSTLIKGAGKVAHTEELRYMWRIDFQGYNNTDIEQFPEDDVVTHRRLLTLWTNFAKTLNPNSKKFEMLENISWPSVATGRPKDLLYLNIDKELTIKSYPKIAAYLGWNMIYDFFGEEEFDTF